MGMENGLVQAKRVRLTTHKSEEFVIMKSGSPKSPVRKSLPARQTDPAKLVSLLVLATGAAAMPQTTTADIIFTDLSSSPVTVGYSGVDHYTFTLPGTAQFGFQRQHATVPQSSVRSHYYRSVVAGRMGGSASVKLQAMSNRFLVARAKGDVWQGQSAANSAFVGMARQLKYVGTTVSSAHYPNSYGGHKYLVFEFSDTSHGGANRFAWADIVLVNGDIGSSGGPDVTIYGWAYDDTGAFIAAGATSVPEPSSTAFLAVGALVLGAKGLHTWRHKQTPAPASQ
jgi:hypothetical protein